MLIYTDTVTMVTPVETTANLYVMVQLHEAASVCYFTISHSSLWPSSKLYSDWLEGYWVEDSTLIGCSDRGCTRKEEQKKEREVNNNERGQKLHCCSSEEKTKKAKL